MIADTLLVDFLPSSADSIRVIKLSVEGFMSTIRDTLALYKIIGRKFDVINRFWGTLALELRTLNYQSKSWRHREISIKTSEQTPWRRLTLEAASCQCLGYPLCRLLSALYPAPLYPCVSHQNTLYSNYSGATCTRPFALGPKVRWYSIPRRQITGLTFARWSMPHSMHCNDQYALWCSSLRGHLYCAPN